MEKIEPSFEELLERLKSVIEKMDNADCTLSEMVNYYSEGKELAAKCEALLDDYQEKLTILSAAEHE